jgi:hypothetical protein
MNPFQKSPRYSKAVFGTVSDSLRNILVSLEKCFSVESESLCEII